MSVRVVREGDAVPAIVAAGLSRTSKELTKASGWRPTILAERAERAARLAELCERQARWWTALERWSRERPDVPPVFVQAVIEARCAQDGHSRFWRDSAADWHRQAAGLRVCGVIGCNCGGDCGVPA